MNTPNTFRRHLLSTSMLSACALSLGLLNTPVMAQTNAKVLSIGMPFSPLSMDPSISGNGRAGVHLSPAYEPLIRTQADGKFAPGLATAWQLSADSKEVTFTLRQNAKFSDGEPVTAEAVKLRQQKGAFLGQLVDHDRHRDPRQVQAEDQTLGPAARAAVAV
jgi:peptide/nickel transport system substrate-binding protein